MILDDEPDDGPQRYVLITGFHHPHLLTYLLEIGVNIDAIINVNSQSYNSTDCGDEVVASEEHCHGGCLCSWSVELTNHWTKILFYHCFEY